MKDRKNHIQIVISTELRNILNKRRVELGHYNENGEFKEASYDKAMKDMLKNPKNPPKRVSEKCQEIKTIMFAYYDQDEEKAHIMELFETIILHSMESLENHRQVDTILNEIIKQIG